MAKFLWLVEVNGKHIALNIDAILSVRDVKGISNIEQEWWYETQGIPEEGCVVIWMQGKDEYVATTKASAEEVCSKLCELSDS